MEYDDRYTSLEANDLDENIQTNSSHKIKKLNRGYHILVRNIVIKDKIQKIGIGVYGSGSNESPIRNAETGEYYKYKVGSMNEDLFFKVIIPTSEATTGPLIPIGPLTLFYDSPEHYERHQYIELDDVIKQKWELKRKSRLNNLK
jgi:hypothetical protein